MLSAKERVLHTPELLEAVLAELPLLDLLHAQRISRGIRAAIQSSPRLQQALFFRTSPKEDETEWEINPLLREPFLPWFVIPGQPYSLPNYKSLEQLDWVSDGRTREMFLRPEASWRKMLMIQPSPTKLNILKTTSAMMGTFTDEANISSQESAGVLMGQIYDITESFLQGQLVSHFGLSVNDSNHRLQMTLCLRYTQQCRRGPVNRKWNLRSDGASVSFYDLNFTSKKTTSMREELEAQANWAPFGALNDSDPVIETDLTSARGGVDPVEWERWRRARAPISSLLSEVR